jgi:hypothetical protein
VSAGKRVVVGPPDAEDTLVPVPATDLWDWAAQLAWITTALEQFDPATRVDVAGQLPDPVTLPGLLAALDRTCERIGGLLDGHGWWHQR